MDKLAPLAVLLALAGCSNAFVGEDGTDRVDDPPREPGEPHRNTCGGGPSFGTTHQLFAEQGGPRPDSGVGFVATVVELDEGVVRTSTDYGALRLPVPSGEQLRFAVGEELTVVMDFEAYSVTAYGTDAQIWVAMAMDSGFSQGFGTELTLPNGARASVGSTVCSDHGVVQTSCGEGSRSTRVSAVVVSHGGEQVEIVDDRPMALGAMVLSAGARSSQEGLVECDDGRHLEAGFFETLEVVAVVPTDGAPPPGLPREMAYPLCEERPRFDALPAGFGPRGALEPSPARVVRVGGSSASLVVAFGNGTQGTMPFEWNRDDLDAYLSDDERVEVSREALAGGFLDVITTSRGEVRLFVSEEWGGATQVAPGVSALMGAQGCYAADTCEDAWGRFSLGVTLVGESEVAESWGAPVEIEFWTAAGLAEERTASGAIPTGECARAPSDERTSSVAVALAR